MIKYYVRTTGERILDESYSQIKYEVLLDIEHNPVGHFIASLKEINDQNSVLLEDDLILCKDFKKRIEEVIDRYPKYIINFFQLPSRYITTNISNSMFRYNQCTYYPKGIGKFIAEEMEKLKVDRSLGYDVIEDLALQKLGLVYVLYRPCLVQHKDIQSIINKNFKVKRRTLYFIDYLDELGITYDEAYKYEKELETLLNNKFKELE